MTVKYYHDLIQGSEEWIAARCGRLAASEMKLLLTPSLYKPSSNEKERAHVYELAAQRITKYVEPHFISDDMLRGKEDEQEVRDIYEKHYAPVKQCGGVTNDRFGFTIWYSPDGLVGDDGLLEGKSRRQRFQVETIIEGVPVDKAPEEFVLQLQTGLMVANDRKWIDFITHRGGLPMATIRCYPDQRIQEAIFEAAYKFEKKIKEKVDKYYEVLASNARLVPTERKTEEEITA